MHGQGFFVEAFVYLAAAVVAVPLAKRSGLGSVLGYLAAGVIVGPFALGLIGSRGEDVMHFAEFGVVMMLFVVGLELEPATLWRLRLPVLGLGGLQVALTAAALTLALALGFAIPWKPAIALGLILALSSTAIALQSLQEKSLLGGVAGQSAFAVLLFQDIAVIPMLALFPLLGEGRAESASHAPLWVETLPGWLHALVVLGGVGGIVAAGRFALGPAFRLIAKTRLRELFTAASLLLVVGIALLMTLLGLSPALGTFVAGVVLAGSEFRHELESHVEPFKGILLGLFFMAVGASIDFGLIAASPGRIAGLLAVVVLVKAALLAALGRAFRLSRDQTVLFTAALAQVGEFAFVLLSFGTAERIFARDLAAELQAVVALSMALTPAWFMLAERTFASGARASAAPPADAEVPTHGSPVIIAGFGRFGQVVGRMLRATGVETTVLDIDTDQIELLKKFGHRVFYGDATRVDLLTVAGAERAKLLVVAIDDPERALALVHTAKKHFPRLRVLARARSRTDAYALVRAGADSVERELFGGSVRMGAAALRALGVRAHRAARIAQAFARHDEHNVREMAREWTDEEGWLDAARARSAALEQTLKHDLSEPELADDSAWDPESLREDVNAGTFRIPGP